FPLPLSLPSTSGSESIPEADIPLRKRDRFTTPTGGYEVGKSSVAAAARQIRPALTIADRLTQIEALQRDVSTLQRQHIDDEDRLTRHTQHEHAQRDVAPEDGDRVAVAMAEAEASRVRNGYDSNGSGPRLAQAVRECTYPDFLKCQPLNFKGTEGVVELTQWFEKIESTVTLEVAQAFPWKTLKKMMTDKYCSMGEIKKLETEMWELKTKGTDVIGYSRRFQELALMCDRTFPKESDRVEKYIGGLPNTIHDSVKFEGTSGNNQNQPQQNKRQNTGRAYAACNSDRNMYTGSKPLCSKCDYHHEGLVGYYRRFIEGFSKIAKPMTKLTQKKVKFKWGDKQEAAFQLLKQKLCSAPIQGLPEGSEDFIVYCDASIKGLGAVLMQRENVI
nr:putative reverse transcriptase domain-containing protein [Tanacetum cinerariifolium]